MLLPSGICIIDIFMEYSIYMTNWYIFPRYTGISLEYDNPLFYTRYISGICLRYSFQVILEYLRDIPGICFNVYDRYIPGIFHTYALKTYSWNIPEIFFYL